MMKLRPKLLIFTAALVAALSAASCASLPDVSDEHYYQNFVKDAQAMQEMGLPVYWLGREFTAGDLTFRGPFGDDFGDEVQGGGIQMHYTVSLNDDKPPYEGASLPLEITIYSQSAWEQVKEDIMDPKIPGESRPVTDRSVTVNGRQADLLSLPLDTRPVNQLWLIVDMGDVVVLTVAGSGGPVTPVTEPLAKPGGPDVNPLINNPDLFVQVMQNLRPYPQ